MNEAARKKANQERLRLIDETIRPNVRAVLRDLERQGLRPAIDADVWRSPEKQLELHKKGVTKVKWGFHCATRDGKPGSLAADIVDAERAWNVDTEWWLRLGGSAVRRGLGWGGFFGVPAHLRRSLESALKRRDWDTALKIGWDPAHVETTRVTIAEARRGKR